MSLYVHRRILLKNNKNLECSSDPSSVRVYETFWNSSLTSEMGRGWWWWWYRNNNKTHRITVIHRVRFMSVQWGWHFDVKPRNLLWFIFIEHCFINMYHQYVSIDINTNILLFYQCTASNNEFYQSVNVAIACYEAMNFSIYI